MADRLEEIQILFQKRNARKRGPTSSAQYNDTIEEIAHDLSSFHDQWNNRLVPLTEQLPDGTQGLSASAVDAFTNGLDGTTFFVDSRSSTTQNAQYYNAPAERPRTVLEQFQNIYTAITVLEENLQNEISNQLLTADQIAVIDASGLFASTHVEGALNELKDQLDNLTGLNFNAVPEDILPSTDNAYNLGSIAKRWNDLYLGPTSMHITSKVTDPGAPPAKDYIFQIDPVTGELTLWDGAVKLMQASDAGTEFPAGLTGAVEYPILNESDGTALDPAYSFLADSTSGMWRDGTGLHFSFGGTDRVYLNAGGLRIVNGQYVGAFGSLGLPLYTFYTDNDTGLWRPGPNELGFQTGGLDAGRINASQNWLIDIPSETVLTNPPRMHFGSGSGLTSLASSANQIMLEGSTAAGMTIATQASGTGSIAFGDPGSNIAGRIRYIHTSNEFNWDVNAQPGVMILGPSSLFLTPGLMQLGDTNFNLDINSGGNGPRVQFDTDDYTEYDRTGNDLSLWIGGTEYVRMSASGLFVDHIEPISTGSSIGTISNRFLSANLSTALTIEGTGPIFDMNESDATANSGHWRWLAQSDTLFLYAMPDSGGGTQFMAFNRTGNTPEQLTLFADLEVRQGLVVGFNGSPYDDSIQIGDASFAIDFASGNPTFYFADAGQDRMVYDRGNNSWQWIVSSQEIMSLADSSLGALRISPTATPTVIDDLSGGTTAFTNLNGQFSTYGYMSQTFTTGGNDSTISRVGWRLNTGPGTRGYLRFMICPLEPSSAAEPNLDEAIWISEPVLVNTNNVPTVITVDDICVPVDIGTTYCLVITPRFQPYADGTSDQSFNLITGYADSSASPSSSSQTIRYSSTEGRTWVNNAGYKGAILVEADKIAAGLNRSLDVTGGGSFSRNLWAGGTGKFIGGLGVGLGQGQGLLNVCLKESDDTDLPVDYVAFDPEYMGSWTAWFENWNNANHQHGVMVNVSSAGSNTYALAVGRIDTVGNGRISLFAVQNDGKVGIGNVDSPVNRLDVEGNVAIGASYSGTSSAPTNGLVVEGAVGLARLAHATPKVSVQDSMWIFSQSGDSSRLELSFDPSGSGGATINSQTGGTWADLHLATNGSAHMMIDHLGNFGFGASIAGGTTLSIPFAFDDGVSIGSGVTATSPPTNGLLVEGQVKITGGTPGLGKVLVSDATGLGSWETLEGSSTTANQLVVAADSDNNDVGSNIVFEVDTVERGRIETATAVTGESLTGTLTSLSSLNWTSTDHFAQSFITTSTRISEIQVYMTGAEANSTFRISIVPDVHATLGTGYPNVNKAIWTSDPIAAGTAGYHVLTGLNIPVTSATKYFIVTSIYQSPEVDGRVTQGYTNSVLGSSGEDGIWSNTGAYNWGGALGTEAFNYIVKEGSRAHHVKGALEVDGQALFSNGAIFDNHVAAGDTLSVGTGQILAQLTSLVTRPPSQEADNIIRITDFSSASIYQGRWAGTIGNLQDAVDHHGLMVGIANSTSSAFAFTVLDWSSQSGTPLFVVRGDGNTGVGLNNPVNKLGVEGAAAIGASYAGTSIAPANGLLVEGGVGIGSTTAPPSGGLRVNADVVAPTMQQYISVSLSTANTAQTGLFNPFNTSTYGGTTSTLSSNGVTFSSTNGRFTINQTGTYEVTAVVYVEQSTTNYLDAFYVRENGSLTVWDGTNGAYIHSSVDPVERTISFIYNFTAGDYIELLVDSSSTFTALCHIGTTFNVKRIA